jgi:type IV fimbrial biogenesis protein FimT
MENRGYTLFELVAALAITAILSFSAVPAFYNLLQQYRLRSTGQQLFHCLTSARATAVMRSKQITAENSDGDWSTGATLFEDDNGNGAQDNGEAVLLRMGNQGNVQIQGNRWVTDYVMFAPDGSAQTTSGAFQVGTITVCQTGYNEAYQLIISIGGRVRMINTEIEEC